MEIVAEYTHVCQWSDGTWGYKLADGSWNSFAHFGSKVEAEKNWGIWVGNTATTANSYASVSSTDKPKVVKTWNDGDVAKFDDGTYAYKTASGNWSAEKFDSMSSATNAKLAYDIKLESASEPTVTKTQHFDGFQIDTYSDGTSGYMTDGGKHKEGYKSKDGAKKAATKLAAAEPKGPQVLKSEDKGGYVINTFSDGTYGYLMPDGTYKNGYKSKDGAGKAGKKLAAKAAKAQAEAQAELLEKQAQALSQKLQQVYGDAVASMTAKLEKELAKFEKDKAKWLEDVARGKKTAEQYQAWLKDQSLHNDQVKAIKKSLAQDLAAADKMAMAYVNDMPAGVYAEGMNFGTYEIEHDSKMDTSFTLYNKNTVMELVANEPDLLPQVHLDEAKDLAWNQKHITSAVTQAVLQGQSIPQLAASIAGVAAMDQRAAMRSARTAMTSAHSLGKLKSYENAAKMGIDVKKRWLAVLDRRTRGSHRHLDGETVKLDKEFSNGLKYPGDPDGAGSEVYNCRCTMVPVIGDVPYDEVKRASKLGDMTYEEWKNEKLTAEQKKAKSLDDQLKQIDSEMDTVKELMKQEDKTYSGIWKDPVTLADWESKKESIPKKIEYYQQKLDAAKEYQDPKLEQMWVDMIDMTNEFDAKGQAYKAHIDKMAQLKLQRQSVHKQMVDLGLVEDSAYSEERKAAAHKFKTPKEADAFMRVTSGRVWANATSAQRDGIYGYTRSSGAWNRPLSGFQKPWSQSGSGWEKKFYKGVNNVWIDFEGKGSQIRRMTEIIEQSTYEEDVWLVRGCDYNAMDSFFGISESKLRGLTTEQMREQLVGQSNRIESFVSCGTAFGKGFSSKPVAMEIYCPAGSEMMYAEPFSHYSGAGYDGKSWDGKEEQNSFGSEDETILQRGGYYTVTDAYKGSDGKMHIVMELHPERGYDKFQQDPSEWTGSKKTYRG